MKFPKGVADEIFWKNTDQKQTWQLTRDSTTIFSTLKEYVSTFKHGFDPTRTARAL